MLKLEPTSEKVVNAASDSSFVQLRSFLRLTYQFCDPGRKQGVGIERLKY